MKAMNPLCGYSDQRFVRYEEAADAMSKPAPARMMMEPRHHAPQAAQNK
jgi:hypothetical protein